MTPPDFDKLAEEYLAGRIRVHSDPGALAALLRRVYEMGVEAGRKMPLPTAPESDGSIPDPEPLI